MVAETSEASKDQQNESATSENNRFRANLSERDLERILEDKQYQTRPRKTRTGVFPRSRMSFKLN